MNSQAPTMKRLPKLHKTNISIGPLGNYGNATSYKISQYSCIKRLNKPTIKIRYKK